MKNLKSIRPHIGIFGSMNVGKSTLINTLSGQDSAIVGNTPGTTTDPVRKWMEIHGLGPVVLIDTAGFNDQGEIGDKRVKATQKILEEIDLGILLLNDTELSKHEQQWITFIKKRSIPFLVLLGKSDILNYSTQRITLLEKITSAPVLFFNPNNPINKILDTISQLLPESTYKKRSILGDIIKKNATVLLVTPIDKEAPEGRMILPQVQVIRDILDNDSICIVLKETQLEEYLKNCSKMPDLVVTDSQAFSFVSKVVPGNVFLTSFSILFARYKGDFDAFLEGTNKILNLQDGDKILILESCTHHAVEDDIGRIKIPMWLKKFTRKDLSFEIISGMSEPKMPWNSYALVIQCGGCMLNKKQMLARIHAAQEAGVPITNYGMVIAFLNGIFERVIFPFIKEVKNENN